MLLSAILAAVMSTLSCQLLVCSSAITEDLYKPFLRKNASQQELVWVGRAMVLVIALIAISVAMNPENRVLGLVSYAWAGFGAAFGPVVLLSVLWSRMTRNGALAGMLVGALTVIVWKQFGWLGLYEIIPGFLFSGLAIVVFSLLDKAPQGHAGALRRRRARVPDPAGCAGSAGCRQLSWLLPITKAPQCGAFTRTSDRSVSKTL